MRPVWCLAINTNPPGMELFQRVCRQAARLARKPFVYSFPSVRNDLSRTNSPCRRMQKSEVNRGWVLEITAEFRLFGICLLGLTGNEIEARLCIGMIETVSSSAVEWRSVVVRHLSPFPYRYSYRDATLRRYWVRPRAADRRNLMPIDWTWSRSARRADYG